VVLSNKSARHQQIRRKLIGLRFVLRSDILVIEISTVVLLYARQGRGLKGLDPINNAFVELRISYLLARATNIKDLSAFEFADSRNGRKDQGRALSQSSERQNRPEPK